MGRTFRTARPGSRTGGLLPERLSRVPDQKELPASDSHSPADQVDHPSDPAQSGAEAAKPYGAPPVAPYPSGDAVPAYGAPLGLGPRGEVRSTGTCILLTIVTLGFYTWYWFYKTHDEMKRHSRQGIVAGWRWS